MRQFLLAASFLLLVCGCGTKVPPPAATEKNTPAMLRWLNTTVRRTKLLKSMKGLNSKARGDAMEELAGWVDTDPESVAALLELLKDRTTTVRESPADANQQHRRSRRDHPALGRGQGRGGTQGQRVRHPPRRTERSRSRHPRTHGLHHRQARGSGSPAFPRRCHQAATVRTPTSALPRSKRSLPSVSWTCPRSSP